MQTYINEDKMFCNGAEEYIGKDFSWTFVTNWEDKYWKLVLAKIQLSGYKVVIDKTSTDVHGNVLPDHFAIYEPEALLEDKAQNKAKDLYFDLDARLNKAYEKKLIDRGVVPPDYFSWKRPCYVGCEKEYGLVLPEDF